MKIQYPSALALVALIVMPTPAAWAGPTMIRLGYVTCSACHISPQGGGLLTHYGKGVDKAQSLIGGEYQPRRPDLRLRQDVRALMVRSSSTGSPESAPDPLWAQLTYRHVFWLTGNARFSYSLGLEGAPVSMADAGSRPLLFVSRALWEYRARQGVEIAVGRDLVPDGLGIVGRDPLVRRGIAAQRAGYATQAKLFLWSDRFELSSYIFGPDGNEASGTGEHGAGVNAGVNLGKRAVLGISTRVGRSDGGAGETLGFYTRLGFGRWGVLAQHEVGNEQSDSFGSGRRHAGYSQFFVAPYEWLVTSVTLERLESAALEEIRLRPEVHLRATNGLTILFSISNNFVEGRRARPSRIYAIQFAAKGMQ